MKIMSNNFSDKGNIPSEFTCDGKNVSPQLSWSEVPSGTKSFALTVTDPDYVGGNWIHWFVHDIAKGVRSIEKDSVPSGAKEVENDFGKRPYDGPCPPSGTHRYVFSIYALDIEHLYGVNKRNFISKVEEHTIDKAIINGFYSRRR